MIKILLPVQHDRISYEGVWAKELSSSTGEINNLPVFASHYKFGRHRRVRSQDLQGHQSRPGRWLHSDHVDSIQRQLW